MMKTGCAYGGMLKGVWGGSLLLLLMSFCLCGVAKTTKPRGNGKKIVLQHADKVSYDQFKNPDEQIFVGNVVFNHEGVLLYCDSANFYQNSNFFEAFGKVRMVQGDTLSLVSKYLFYDGNTQIAQARQEVILKHRNTYPNHL